MAIKNLRHLFNDQLADIYDAEKQYVTALPSIIAAASDPALVKTLKIHLEESKAHYQMVNDILASLDVNPRNTKCEAMQGLLAEVENLIEEDADDDARDAGIIAMIQKIEHYEIATYGTLRNWAARLGENNIHKHLVNILDVEYRADNALDALADSYINRAAEETVQPVH